MGDFGPGKSLILGFMFFFVLGSILSYGTTIFLFLPCLFLASRVTLLTARLTCLMGTVLGGVVCFPVLWQTYLTSGDNSEPSPGTFVEYLWQHLYDSEAWAFLVAGLVTAMVYWFLANN